MQEQSSLELEETFNDSREILTHYDKLKESYITTPVLSKYERTTIIGVRAQQISSGAKVLINVPEYMSNTIDIASLELEQRKTPFIIKRKVGNQVEYWKLEDLKDK